jgi:hypothetical protein
MVVLLGVAEVSCAKTSPLRLAQTDTGSVAASQEIQSDANAGPESVRFDLSKTSHGFMGFGAQIWGYAPDERYPDLLEIRRKALSELNIKYVRIENSAEWAAWEGMKQTRAMTDELGIKWVYMIWGAPGEYASDGRLVDIEGFADWWVTEVKDLYDHGIETEYIELMNEPDSRGWWSTGITGEQYTSLVKFLRPKLDAAGFKGVGIVGAGPSNIWASRGYSEAFDSEGVLAMAAWSTHAWGGDSRRTEKPGGSALESVMRMFVEPTERLNPSLPKFVTEYSTHARRFNGVEHPHGDRYGEWDADKVFPYYSVTNTMGYAVRVYENTLALLNSGANAAFLWQANDEPTETNPPGYGDGKRKSWGALDLWGKPKPVFGALKTLHPKLPIGARVVVSPDQSANAMYAGAYISGNCVVVGISNNTESEKSSTLRLTHAPAGLKIVEAIAFEQSYWGSAEKGDPDVGRTVTRKLALQADGAGQCAIDVTLPADSTLTVVLDTGSAE